MTLSPLVPRAISGSLYLTGQSVHTHFGESGRLRPTLDVIPKSATSATNWACAAGGGNPSTNPNTMRIPSLSMNPGVNSVQRSFCVRAGPFGRPGSSRKAPLRFCKEKPLSAQPARYRTRKRCCEFIDTIFRPDPLPSSKWCASPDPARSRRHCRASIAQLAFPSCVPVHNNLR
jgi:hypothetical protein